MNYYLKIPSDGASFKCRQCQQQFPHHKVILVTDGNKKPVAFGVICLNCIGIDWINSAKCLGMSGC